MVLETEFKELKKTFQNQAKKSYQFLGIFCIKTRIGRDGHSLKRGIFDLNWHVFRRRMRRKIKKMGKNFFQGKR